MTLEPRPACRGWGWAGGWAGQVGGQVGWAGFLQRGTGTRPGGRRTCLGSELIVFQPGLRKT